MIRTLLPLMLVAAAWGQELRVELRSRMPPADSSDAGAVLRDLERLDQALQDEGCVYAVEQHLLALYPLREGPALRAWQERLQELAEAVAALEMEAAPGRWLVGIYGEGLQRLHAAVGALAAAVEAGEATREAWDQIAVEGQHLARFDLGYLSLIDWALARETTFED